MDRFEEARIAVLEVSSRTVVAVCVGALAYALIYAISLTGRWPIFHDHMIFHYMGQRILAGDVPYRDFLSQDLPITLLLHAGAIYLFGPLDEGIRVFNYCWLFLTALSIVILFGRRHLLFGSIAAMFYSVYYLSLGAAQMLQRDFLMLAFLLFAASLMQSSNRKYHAAAGALVCCAAGIKPSGIIFGLGIVFLSSFNRDHLTVTTFFDELSDRMVSFVIGVLSIVSAIVVWLWWIGAVMSFVEALGFVVQDYRKIGPFAPFDVDLVRNCLLVVALISAGELLGHFSDRYRIRALVWGICYGNIHFFTQPYGFQHRYAPIMFFSIIAVFFVASLKSAQSSIYLRAVFLSLLVLATYVVSPFNPAVYKRFDVSWVLWWRDQHMSDVRGAAAQLSPTFKRNDGTFSMQFLDTIQGFWYSAGVLGILPPTRCVYALHFDMDNPSPLLRDIQNSCMSTLEIAPPGLIGATVSSLVNQKPSYSFLKYPRLAQLLADRYKLFIERPDYRIYVRVR